MEDYEGVISDGSNGTVKGNEGESRNEWSKVVMTGGKSRFLFGL